MTRILESFASYNQAVWPVQPVLMAVAIGVVALALKDVPWRARSISGLLAVLWVWMAVAYQWTFIGGVLGKTFAGLFVAQAGLLLFFGFSSRGMHFRPQGDLLGFAGSFMVACALMLHPVISIRVGHGFPAFPTFGLPSPTIIFTLGVLLWAKPRAHESLFVVPVLWTIVSAPSMLTLLAAQDWLLAISVLSAAAFILWQRQIARLNKLASAPVNPAWSHVRGEVRQRQAHARAEAHANKRATRWSAQPMQPVGK